MTKKLLFRYTSTLLRTALLLGALILVNTQAKAQIAGMPDAFETMDLTANPSIIGNEQYYYIQFFDGDENSMTRCYLSDQGAGNNLRSKDYLPFAKNIQWTLVSAGGSNFYLKSGLNNFVRLDGTNYKSTNNQGEATPLTVYKMPDGSHYEISTAANTANAMYREGGRVWTNIIDGSHNYAGKDHNMSRCYLRIARLKDNVAHIIYYQDPVYNNGVVADANGEYRGGREGFAKHHYLTYSNTGAQEQTNNWTSLITNGDMTGTDVSSFYIGENQPATIEDESGRMGSRGIVVNSAANQEETWSTQFFVQASEVIGRRTVHLEFDYKANRNNNIQVQAKTDVFSSYITHIGAIGNLGFTTSWKHYSGDFSIDNDNFKMIAFDLGMKGNQAATFYFDNIVFSVRPNDFRASDVSSRSSVLDSYDAWSIPTAAKYHEDGLWTLEKGADTETGAEFYIKKYGTSQYMNPVKDNDDVSPSLFYCVLGNQDNNLGRYVLEQPNNNRFTRIRNNTSGWGYTRHLSYSNGDGWPAMQLNEANTNPNFWYAGFLPVEVPDPTEEDVVRVLLGVKRDKRTDNRIRLTGGNKEVQINSSDNLYSATFKPSQELTNVFQIKNLRVGCYNGLVIEFDPIEGDDWNISGIVNGQQGWTSLPAGTTRYEMDLTGFSSIDDLTVFNWNAGNDHSSITIKACYFTPEGPEPDCPSSEMLNYDGNTSPYSTETLKRQLWELEQVDDYGHFRLKTGNRYFQDMGQMTDNVNNAAVFTNESLLKYFDLKWFSIAPEMLQKEIDVSDRMVTHKVSYLREYADDYPSLDIAKQGLASDIDSDWKNENGTQKTNHFEITHYVKQGESLDVYFPTILDGANDHVYYQRWYNYGEDDDNMDLDNLKAHLNLDVSGDVQYYLYKNGIVTGDKLYWEPTSGGYRHNAIDHVRFTNSDGQEFTLAADVSRYSDYQYANTDDPLSDDLEEPTLTMRYIYHMKDASEMADKLSTYGKQVDSDVDEKKWMEYKTIHFPAKQVAYNDNKWEGYRGEFIGLRHVFSDYWVYNGSTLVSAVDDGNASGKIEVKIYDPNDPDGTLGTGSGITLGGYNPFVNPRGSGEVQPSPQVGDKIRVYYTNKQGNFNPRFKHGYNNWDGIPDWDEFQNNYQDNGSYLEAEIRSAGAAAELTSSGLRFQGQGFTMTRVEIVPPDGNPEGRQTTTIYSGNDVFATDNWNTIVTINGSNVRVNFSNPGVINNYYQGFYFYDKIFNRNGNLPEGKTQYGDSRFVVFRYPKDNEGNTTAVTNTGPDNPVYLRVYFNDNGTRYQLAQFTLIFDENCETLPWTSVNGSDEVRETSRDPKNLRQKAGDPIAKITFDYPAGDTYHYPSTGTTLHARSERPAGGTIDNSSPLPLTFDHTNYSFDGDGCNWAAYAMVSQKRTEWGNDKDTYPADDASAGYDVDADLDMQKAFLYIDASEQPGDICAMAFQGEFCEGDKLMCSGWISGSNRYSDNGSYRCPGGITLTVKGEPLDGGDKDDIYRFCPGQCYELDNGTGVDGSTDANKVVWQQFYFEFSIDKKYKKYWLEVNNNCVSSNGGDFMLDNVEVYAFVPEVIPEMNTPICINKDANEMQLLKISVGFDKILTAVKETELTGDNSKTMNMAFLFLEKDVFLKTFKEQLMSLNGVDKTIEELEIIIEEGSWGEMVKSGQPYYNAYKAAFDAAVLGDPTTIWDSGSPDAYKSSAVLNFSWNTNFSKMQPYSFTRAVNKKGAVFAETNPVTEERFIVMNGNYPNELPWKINTDYYIVPYNSGITDISYLYEDFNICSSCSKKRVFQIKPPLSILSTESYDETQDLVVCEGKIPTLLTDMKGYDVHGNLVPMKDLNFDWWLGDPTATPAVKATLEEYHSQKKTITYVDENGNEQTEVDVRLDNALSALRAYYKDATDLDGIIEKLSNTPNLTHGMVVYLKELLVKGQLVLHQKSISIPAKKTSDDDPYFYLVACPIHDEKFDQALKYHDGDANTDSYVAFFCDEPQGLKMKVSEKSPTLKCGFVSGENGFDAYDYAFPEGTDPVLSIRLAKAEQFEKVRNKNNEADGGTISPRSDDLHYLWLPIRNAETESASGVVKKAQDDNIYLASTNDPVWDKNIYTAMTRDVPSLPVVGRIVQLNAVNTGGNASTVQTSNRLCVYFTKTFEVREGYNYTLSLPFQEEGDVNACDGTILINLKIVPDYEVWTGGADNTDWNNDQNWRRADGNTDADQQALVNERNSDELYVGAAKDGSPLKNYVTNRTNYRTSKDRIFRKGFAPLYCTHVLISKDEWGDAPVLYDAIDTQSGKSTLAAKPFPNLRDQDGWDGTSGEDATKATATSILRFDMQARLHELWQDTYGSVPDKESEEGDLLAEMYQVNTCDEIVFQSGAELLNAHLLNYNNAWVEYELDNRRWYLLGSSLQGTIAGEWYAPTGTAQQKTTYYDPVTFGTGYDRYSPAIYQRSWDKAKAVLYEVGSAYSTEDNPNDLQLTEGQLPGSSQEGYWDNSGQTPVWNATGADDYLDRLGYKPMGGNKANVAIKGVWSNTYNDVTVDYTKGGFSVMVMNHLKGNDTSGGKSVIRLPKEDTMYDYYSYNQTGAADGGTDTDIDDDVQDVLNRAKNRGRLKTDLLLPTSAQKTEPSASIYGDQRTFTRIPIKEDALTTMINNIGNHQETVSPGISDNMNFYLVENPFPCGLDMKKFFAANTGLEKKYWLLTATGQHLVQQASTGEWVSPTDTPNDGDFALTDGIVVPGQGFFVEATAHNANLDIVFNKDMQAKTRYGKRSGKRTFTVEVGQTQVMEEKIEDVDLNGNGIFGEEGITLEGETVDEKVTVMVPKYIEDPENSGTMIPVLQPITEEVTVYTYVQSTADGEVFSLKGRTRGGEANLAGLVITAQRGSDKTSALVMQREEASDDFLPSEDTEVFITSDFESVPTVYTLCGRLATTINSIHEFRSLPLGVESNSDAPCTLTFKGVEALGDSVAFYDAVEQTLTPLESGMQVSVSGQTRNRYYLVRSLSKEEAAAETHIQIFTEGLTAKVIASTAEPIVSVRCFDTAGRLIHSASPQSTEYSFTLPISGVYIIEAETENDRKTKKLMAR